MPELGCLYEKTLTATISPESGEETVLTLTITQDHIGISAQCYSAPGWHDIDERCVFYYEYDSDRKSTLKQAAMTLREMIILFDEWAGYIENCDKGVPRNRVPERSAIAVANCKAIIADDDEQRNLALQKYTAETVK